MTEIEKLKLERAMIDERIRQLENEDIVIGDAKFAKIMFMDKQIGYGIFVEHEVLEARRTPYKRYRWNRIIAAYNKEDAISALPSMIHDLEELYNTLTENY